MRNEEKSHGYDPYRSADDLEMNAARQFEIREKVNKVTNSPRKRHTLIPGDVRQNNLNPYGVPRDIAGAQISQPARISKEDRIKVCIRKRPLSKKEMRKGEADIVTVGGKRTIVVNEPKYCRLETTIGTRR